jgi:hypothetical protein
LLLNRRDWISRRFFVGRSGKKDGAAELHDAFLPPEQAKKERLKQ